MKYMVSSQVDVVVEVPDGTSSDEFYELYHNIVGVSITATSGDEEKIRVLTCVDETSGISVIKE